MNNAGVRRKAGVVALAIIVIAALTGCSIQESEETIVATDAEARIESDVLAAVSVASGVYVSQSSSGLGNDVVQVRLYVDTDDVNALTDAVDIALETTWHSWPRPLSVIKLGLVVGPKPADVGTADVHIRDLADVASRLGIAPNDVQVNITLSAPDLIERYGEWDEPTDG